MKSCICIKESRWFELDDSFKNSDKGGDFIFHPLTEYQYTKHETVYGTYFNLYHKDKIIHFEEQRFFSHFKIKNYV